MAAVRLFFGEVHAGYGSIISVCRKAWQAVEKVNNVRDAFLVRKQNYPVTSGQKRLSL
jgi:hypothetical protein